MDEENKKNNTKAYCMKRPKLEKKTNRSSSSSTAIFEQSHTPPINVHGSLVGLKLSICFGCLHRVVLLNGVNVEPLQLDH